MLDQSFSSENFRIILDVENRQGRYLEDSNFFNIDRFKDSREITDKIIEINRLIGEEKKKLPLKHLRTKKDYEAVDKLEDEKNSLKLEREERLENILQSISAIANDDKFKLIIKKGITKFGSQLYVVDNLPEYYFVLKQLQRNIYKTFKVKQANRKEIIAQLKLLLDDNFPKIVFRTDIKGFYESIPHKQLISLIDENSLLSYPSKKIIKDILNQYWKILIADGIKNIEDERVGIPRGVGISAFLSELYLKDLDNIISNISNVSFYARYVDDFIIVFTPTDRKESKTTNQYKNEIKNIISKFNLEMNSTKTNILDLRKTNSDRKSGKRYEITYLGYKFILLYKKEKNDKGQPVIRRKKLSVLMSDNKMSKFENKIKLAFKDYEYNIIKYKGKESAVNKVLIQRMKVLSHNYQLYRRKSYVYIGIYFSNEYLTTELSNLKILDSLLKNEIIRTTHLLSKRAKEKLDNISFEKGFKDKRTLNFNFNQRTKKGSLNIDRVVKIWSNL